MNKVDSTADDGRDFIQDEYFRDGQKTWDYKVLCIIGGQASEQELTTMLERFDSDVQALGQKGYKLDRTTSIELPYQSLTLFFFKKRIS